MRPAAACSWADASSRGPRDGDLVDGDERVGERADVRLDRLHDSLAAGTLLRRAPSYVAPGRDRGPCTPDSRVLGPLPPFEAAEVWWPEATSIVGGVRKRHDLDVEVLRLLTSLDLLRDVADLEAVAAPASANDG